MAAARRAGIAETPHRRHGSNLYPVSFAQTFGDIPRSIRLMEECGMEVRVVGETDGPFRDYYFEDEAFLRQIAAIPGGYSIRDGVHYERLIVFEATLP